MSYGVIINEPQKPIVRAPFYVPLLTPGTEFKSSHVYLDSHGFDKGSILSAIAEVPPNVVVIIHFDEKFELIDFINVLLELSHPIAIVLPVSDNLEYWYSVRDAKSRLQHLKIGIILNLNSHISNSTLARFNCLSYSSIILLAEEYDIARRLLNKPVMPTLLIPQNLAKKKPVEFWQCLANPSLERGLDLLIDPLQPLVVDLELDVYDTFQTDVVKYRQYDCAIDLAMLDLRVKKRTLNILVIGAGKGPLLKSTIEHAFPQDFISVIEKNPQCISILEEIAQQRPNTMVKCADIRDISSLDQYDLVISELLGSFGCNEACPEILQIFKNSNAIVIPTEYCSIIQPIYTGLDMKRLHRPYLVNLSASYSVVKPQLAFKFVHPGKNDLCQENKFEFRGSARESVNALCGFFEATLYGPYKIGNFPSLSSLEKCDSWFPLIFPIREERFPLKVRVSRISDHDLRYLWEVNGATYGDEEIDNNTYKVSL